MRMNSDASTKILEPTVSNQEEKKSPIIPSPEFEESVHVFQFPNQISRPSSAANVSHLKVSPSAVLSGLKVKNTHALTRTRDIPTPVTINNTPVTTSRLGSEKRSMAPEKRSTTPVKQNNSFQVSLFPNHQSIPAYGLSPANKQYTANAFQQRFPSQSIDTKQSTGSIKYMKRTNLSKSHGTLPTSGKPAELAFRYILVFLQNKNTNDP